MDIHNRFTTVHNHTSGQARKNSAVYVSLSSDKLVKQQCLKRIKILKTHRSIQTSIPAKRQNQNSTKRVKTASNAGHKPNTSPQSNPTDPGNQPEANHTNQIPEHTVTRIILKIPDNHDPQPKDRNITTDKV